MRESKEDKMKLVSVGREQAGQSEYHSVFRSMNTPSRAGEMTELVKCSPRGACGPGVQAPDSMSKDGCGGACNPTAEEVETGRSLGLRWSRLTYGAATMTPTVPLETLASPWPSGPCLG